MSAVVGGGVLTAPPSLLAKGLLAHSGPLSLPAGFYGVRSTALRYLEGKLIYRTEQKHTDLEWLRFLKQFQREVPKEVSVHIIGDNYSTRKSRLG